MKKYKIGEVAKIVDIPAESIRFFESKGLISPEKDPFNKYRYYDVWDINRLYDYKKFRNLDFSLAESIDIVKSSSFETMVEHLNDKQEEADKMARYYELKSLKLQSYQNVLKNIPLLLGEYPVVNRPEGYYFINRTYDGEEFRFDKAEDWKGYFDELLQYYAFVENIYRIRKERFEQPDGPEEYQWGFTIKKKWADALDIKINSKMMHISPVKSIYTIICAEGKEAFSSRLFRPVFEYMKTRGYQLSGDILGNHLITTQQDNTVRRYMEVWIPISES